MPAFTLNGAPLPYGSFRDADGTGYPANVLDVWSDEDLAAIPGVVVRLPDPPPPEPGPPSQVAMHKVQKAARLTPWDGYANLKEAIEAAFAMLPAPSDALAAIEWDKAPNLVRDGATTAAVMALLGMTEAQRDDLLVFADSLP